MKFLRAFILLAALICVSPELALSAVTVYDEVAVKGREIMLRAETRGTFLKEGGDLVEFFVNKKSIGKNLSGNNGIAVKPFVPERAGLHKLSVKSGDDTNNGILLALEKKARIVFIDVAGSIMGGLLDIEVRPESKKAVARIGKRFPVVFLQRGLVTVEAMRAWLKKNNFPSAPVLPWSQGDVFRDIKEKGLSIKAVIGGEEVIESAKEYKPLAFSFDSVEDAEVVENWGEIEKKLK
ncbi:MAG TPA: hypothetical protein VLZ07_11220 [Syntrophales bacterium]|nr:hypothetical protein [Syntrophales bacterium]